MKNRTFEVTLLLTCGDRYNPKTASDIAYDLMDASQLMRLHKHVAFVELLNFEEIKSDKGKSRDDG